MAKKPRSIETAAAQQPHVSITYKGVRHDDPDKETMARILAAQNNELATARNIVNALPAQAERPEWIDETPDQTEEYQLGMWVDGTSVQLVDMRRDEFLALKGILAKLRGYDKPEPKPEERAA